MRVGLVVDAVTEVLMVSEDAVEPTPEVASGYDAAYIRGIAKLGEELVILLDLARCSASTRPGWRRRGWHSGSIAY